jgi:hypothetical protein
VYNSGPDQIPILNHLYWELREVAYDITQQAFTVRAQVRHDNESHVRLTLDLAEKSL